MSEQTYPSQVKGFIHSYRTPTYRYEPGLIVYFY